MNFGMDGPQVTGWWVNPKTGDKFKAIDTYFEDNNLLIKTADGRFLNYNQIQNYIQTDNPDSVMPVKQTTQNTNFNDIPAEVLAEIDNDENANNVLIPDDNIYGLGGPKQDPMVELGNIYEGEELVKPSIEDFDIIDRALKNKETATIDSKVIWNEFPKREIEMLVDVMSIPEDSIVQYYINKISMSTIKESIGESIKSYIKNSLHSIEKQTKESSGVTVQVKVFDTDELPSNEDKPKKTKKK